MRRLKVKPFNRGVYVNGKLPPPTEDQEQVALASYLDMVARDKWFHVPNGSHKSIAQRMRFKRLGLKPGVPDVWVVIPKKGFYGLVIEMKRQKGGVVSDEQKKWVEYLRNVGFSVHVCKGAGPAVEVVNWYLDCNNPGT